MKISNSSKIKLFWAIALAMIVPAITLCAVYFETSRHSVIQNVSNAYSDMLVQSASIVDNEIDNVAVMAGVYADTSWVKTITYMQNGRIDYSRLDLYTLNQHAEMLRRTATESALFNRTALVFADKNITISNEGVWPTAAMFKNEFTSTGLTPQEMLEYVLNNAETSYIYPKDVNDDNIYVISKLPFLTGSYTVQYVARISRRSLSKLLNHSNDVEVVVYAPNGTLLTSSQGIVQDNMADGKYTIDGKEYLVFSKLSLKNGWKYVCCVPYIQMFSAINRIKNIVLMICIVLIVLSAAVVLIITQKTYKPIEKIGRSALKYIPSEAIHSVDIIDVLENSYEFLLGKSNEMIKQINAFEPLARETFFSKLVCGVIPQDNILSLASMVGVNLSKNYWLAILVSFEPSTGDAIAKKLAENFDGYLVHVRKGTMLFIVGIDAVTKCIEKVKECFSSIGAPVGISNAHEQIAELSSAFIEANIALDAAGKCDVITYMDATRITGMDFEYSQKIENAYVNMMRSSDYDAAVHFINDLIDKASLKGTLSVRCLMYNLLSTIAKVCRVDNLEIDEYQDDYTTLDSMEELRMMLLRLTRLICRAERQHLYGKPDLCMKIRAYLKDEFRNSELSLATIAEHFGITPQHVSKVLKEGCGMNFLDILTSMRIDEAKEIIGNEQLTLEQVAKCSGFDNELAFRRAFKKNEGILPSDYRQRISTNSD